MLLGENNPCMESSFLILQCLVPFEGLLSGPTLPFTRGYDNPLEIEVLDPNGINSCTVFLQVNDPLRCGLIVPTMSQWGIILLTIVLLIVGIIGIKQRNRWLSPKF
jgi:hypothetical protein